MLVVHPDGSVRMFLDPVTCDQALGEFPQKLKATLSRRCKGRPLSGDHVLASGATYYVTYVSPPHSPSAPPAQSGPSSFRPAPQTFRSPAAEGNEQGSIRRVPREGAPGTRSGPLSFKSSLPQRATAAFPVSPYDLQVGHRDVKEEEAGKSGGAGRREGEEGEGGAVCWGERASEDLMHEVQRHLPQAAVARLMALNRSLAAPSTPLVHQCSLPSLDRCLNSGLALGVGSNAGAHYQPLLLGECLCDVGSLISPASTSSSSYHPLASPLTPPSHTQEPSCSSSSSHHPLSSPLTPPPVRLGSLGCHPKLRGEEVPRAPSQGSHPQCKQQGHSRGVSEVSPEPCRASEAVPGKIADSDQSDRVQELLAYLGSQPQEREEAARRRGLRAAPSGSLMTQSAVFRRRTNDEAEAAASAKVPLGKRFNISGSMRFRAGEVGIQREDGKSDVKVLSGTAKPSSSLTTAKEKLVDGPRARSHGRTVLVKSRTKTSDCKEDHVPKSRFMRALAALGV